MYQRPVLLGLLRAEKVHFAADIASRQASADLYYGAGSVFLNSIKHGPERMQQDGAKGHNCERMRGTQYLHGSRERSLRELFGFRLIYFIDLSHEKGQGTKFCGEALLSPLAR